MALSQTSQYRKDSQSEPSRHPSTFRKSVRAKAEDRDDHMEFLVREWEATQDTFGFHCAMDHMAGRA
jgi:hypothetical protein